MALLPRSALLRVMLTSLFVAGLGLAALTQRGAAQSGNGAAPKPYRAVTVRTPALPKDAAFAALRKDLAALAERKDRAALAAKVVDKDFFWERDFGGGFDANRSGIDNLVAALSLESDEGWDMLAAFAAEPSAAPLPGREAALCAPAPPQFDEAARDRLIDETESDGLEWVYPRTTGVVMRSAPQPRAAAVETLGSVFLRALGPSGGENDADPFRTAWMRIVAPNGKVGFVAPGQLLSPYSDRLCYAKDASGAWKIAGYVGGGD